MFVFKDLEDYKENGKDADTRFAEQQMQRKRSLPGPKKQKKSSGLIGRTVTHKTSGKGVVKNFDGTVLTVKFQIGETKTFNYAICLEKQLLQIDEVTD